MAWMWPVGLQILLWTSAAHAMALTHGLVIGAALATLGPKPRAGRVVDLPPARRPSAAAVTPTGAKVIALRRGAKRPSDR